VAHSWLAEVFEPTIHSVPVEMRRKLEPAEIFHEILEHRWYMSEAQDRYVTTQEAVEDYVATVLPQHRDERAYLGGGDTQEMEGGGGGPGGGVPGAGHPPLPVCRANSRAGVSDPTPR